MPDIRQPRTIRDESNQQQSTSSQERHQATPSAVITQPELTNHADRPALRDRERSLRDQLAAYTRQGYEPTHTVCSLIGYLIGVKETCFTDMEHTFLERQIYEAAEKHNSLRNVRLICGLRDQVMRRYGEIDWDLKHGMGQKHLEEQIRLLYRREIDLSPRREKSTAEYLLRINRELSRALDLCKRDGQELLPSSVEYMRIRNLITFPGNRSSAEAVKQMCRDYSVNRNRYPWQCYMNIDLNQMPPGNPLAGDDEIVRYAYSAAGEKFEGIWRMRTPVPAVDTLESLHSFLDPVGNYTFRLLIDGTSVTVEEVLALFKELTEQELKLLSMQGEQNILLFCCSELARNWLHCLGNYQDYIHFIEVSSKPGSPERMEDISANVALSLFGLPERTAVLLMTRDPQVFQECRKWSKYQALCVLTDRFASEQILNEVCRNHMAYGFIGDLAVELLPDHLEQLEEILKQRFPLRLGQNLYTITKECLSEMPLGYTEDEKQTFYRRLKQRMKLDVHPDGEITIKL